MELDSKLPVAYFGLAKVYAEEYNNFTILKNYAQYLRLSPKGEVILILKES